MFRSTRTVTLSFAGADPKKTTRWSAAPARCLMARKTISRRRVRPKSTLMPPAPAQTSSEMKTLRQVKDGSTIVAIATQNAMNEVRKPVNSSDSAV